MNYIYIHTNERAAVAYIFLMKEEWALYDI